MEVEEADQDQVEEVHHQVERQREQRVRWGGIELIKEHHGFYNNDRPPNSLREVCSCSVSSRVKNLK